MASPVCLSHVQRHLRGAPAYSAARALERLQFGPDVDVVEPLERPAALRMAAEEMIMRYSDAITSSGR